MCVWGPMFFEINLDLVLWMKIVVNLVYELLVVSRVWSSYAAAGTDYLLKHTKSLQG